MHKSILRNQFPPQSGVTVLLLEKSLKAPPSLLRKKERTEGRANESNQGISISTILFREFKRGPTYGVGFG